MPSRHRKLDAVVTRLQLQYGPRAIRRAAAPEMQAAVACISTTFPALDAELAGAHARAGKGGLPRGRISEIVGPATSGKVTLAAKVVAAAHQEGEEIAAWLDLSRTCDPDYLYRCGVDLERLLIVRPADAGDALAIALHLVESGTLAALVFDGLADLLTVGSPEGGPAAEDASRSSGTLERLASVVTRTSTAILFLTEPQALCQTLAHVAAVRLGITRERWLTRHGDVRGYEGHVKILKNKLGRSGAVVPVRITFNGTVRGDGL
jgi:recombination protein RecA